LDTSYLRHPEFLSVNVLEKEHKELILDAAKKAMYYGKIGNGYGFSDTQIQKIKRTYDYTISDTNTNRDLHKKQFVKYVTEYDKRRGTNFKETFPQLKEYYDKYKD
jgi:hypothetical protein